MSSLLRRLPNPLWVYAYTIVPAQASRRFDTIRALLEGENLAALHGLGAWAGRLILEQKVVHILIVTDTPVRNREINWKLEAELDRLNATFSVTEPLAVANAHQSISSTRQSTGTGIEPSRKGEGQSVQNSAADTTNMGRAAPIRVST